MRLTLHSDWFLNVEDVLEAWTVFRSLTSEHPRIHWFYHGNDRIIEIRDTPLSPRLSRRPISCESLLGKADPKHLDELPREGWLHQ